MAIVDEENRAETEVMVVTMLQASSVVTTNDETKLVKEVNVGLNLIGSPSPALYKKTKTSSSDVSCMR